MAFKPWLTSNDLIEAVKRKIALPINQETFTEEDILKFLNEEMMISQVPSMLQYHEEFFVTFVDTPLVLGQFRYEIPDRAIGMRMRELNFVDPSGNIYEMTRINPDDKNAYQRSMISTISPYAFYIEGNEIVLPPTTGFSSSGKLRFYIYLRPNQLVKNERAMILSSFVKEVTVASNAELATNNSLTIDKVPLSPAIGVTETATAANLVTAINTSTLNEYITATNVGPVVTITSTKGYIDVTSSTLGYVVSTVQVLVSDSILPVDFSLTELYDFLQTKPGHKIRSYDKKATTWGNNTLTFKDADIPKTLVTGDYICLANECIIPQIPPDLHNALADRACSRILTAQGDTEGMQMMKVNLNEFEKSQGSIIDNRAEANPLKITARHSPLRMGKIGRRRSF